jgi:hypothetical protein
MAKKIIILSDYYALHEMETELSELALAPPKRCGSATLFSATILKISENCKLY